MINQIKKELSKKQGKNILILLNPIRNTGYVMEKIEKDIKPKMKRRNQLFYKKGNKITILSANTHNTRGWGKNTKIILLTGSELSYERQKEMLMLKTICGENLQVESLEDFLNSKLKKTIFEKIWERIVELGKRKIDK